jgi:hypothetical protein
MSPAPGWRADRPRDTGIDGISDRTAGRRLSAALQGRGAFRRFRNQLHEHPRAHLACEALRDARTSPRAAQWLVDEGPVDEDAAQRFPSEHPEPDLPSSPYACDAAKRSTTAR